MSNKTNNNIFKVIESKNFTKTIRCEIDNPFMHILYWNEDKRNNECILRDILYKNDKIFRVQQYDGGYSSANYIYKSYNIKYKEYNDCIEYTESYHSTTSYIKIIDANNKLIGYCKKTKLDNGKYKYDEVLFEDKNPSIIL